VDGNQFALSFFDFTSVRNHIRHGAFSENSFWYTSTVKVEINFYFISYIERFKCSGIKLKILQFSSKDSDVENYILVACYSLSDRGFGG